MGSDLIVIGGGVMGLFTAYHASERGTDVVVLERGRIGDPLTASYGRTRSFRNDYLDATYTRLAHEAFRLWGEFEARTGTRVLVRCGCMNIAKRAVTPDLDATYAQRSHDVLARARPADGVARPRGAAGALPLPRRRHGAPRRRTPASSTSPPSPARCGACSPSAGSGSLEGVETTAIERDGEGIRVVTGAGELTARALVVTAGHGTNDVLARLPGCDAAGPALQGPPERGEVRRAARGDARALHGARRCR